MKKKKLYLLLVVAILGSWLFFFNGAYPHIYPAKSVEKITIKVYHPETDGNWPNSTYSTNEEHVYFRTLTSQEDIYDFIQTLDVIWDGIFPINSIDSGPPYYRINIIHKNGKKTLLLFNESEWGCSAQPSERILKYMEKLMS